MFFIYLLMDLQGYMAESSGPNAESIYSMFRWNSVPYDLGAAN